MRSLWRKYRIRNFESRFLQSALFYFMGHKREKTTTKTACANAVCVDDQAVAIGTENFAGEEIPQLQKATGANRTCKKLR